MHRVLLIEPETQIADLLSLLMAHQGLDVAAVRSLPDAIGVLSNSRFDLIFTEAFGQRDILELDSSFLDEIRAYAGDTPIVLCSTYTVARAADLGLAAVVSKPFSVDDFSETVSKLLAKTL